jgi:alkylated DNA nucleotide flippase Atl1
VQTSSSDAVVRLAAKLAEALQSFVQEYNAPIDDGLTEEQLPSSLGHRQRQAHEILLAGPSDGMKTAEIAEAMKPPYDVPNCYLTLRSLLNRGLVELLAGSSPQRWRVANRARGSSAPFMAAAQLVRRGEWATYGDLSIALRGDDKAARAIGRAAATLPDFPNPERILQAGGVVPEGWHDDDGRGPEECRRRLEEQDVTFMNGRADPTRRLSWETLRERLVVAGVDVPPLATVP